MYDNDTEGSRPERDPSAGKNQAASVRALWSAIACVTLSLPIQNAWGEPADAVLISVRCDADNARSTRLSLNPRARAVTVPVSWVEPAIHVTLPFSVMSVIAVPFVRAAIDCLAKLTAGGVLTDGLCAKDATVRAE